MSALEQLVLNPDTQFRLVGLGVAPALRQSLRSALPGDCAPVAHVVTLLCRVGHSQGAVLARAGVGALRPASFMLTTYVRLQRKSGETMCTSLSC